MIYADDQSELEAIAEILADLHEAPGPRKVSKYESHRKPFDTYSDVLQARECA